MDNDGDEAVDCDDPDCEADEDCVQDTCRDLCERVGSFCFILRNGCEPAVMDEILDHGSATCTEDADYRRETAAVVALNCQADFDQIADYFGVADRCSVEPERCTNGVDDDADGSPDCADEDCSEHVNCVGATRIGVPRESVQLMGSLDFEGEDCCRESLLESCHLGPAVSLSEAHRIVNLDDLNHRLQITITWSDPANAGLLSLHEPDLDINEPSLSCLRARSATVEGDAAEATLYDVLLPVGATLNVLASTTRMTEDQEAIPAGAYTITILTTTEEAEENCGDGIDDDENGVTDCLDPACEGGPACVDGAVDLAAPGEVISIAGALDAEDPLWARPTDQCDGYDDGYGFHYDTIAVRNPSDEARTVTFDLIAQNDAYLHVFRPPYRLRSLEGCDRGEDFHYLPNVDIAPRETIVAVVSTYQRGALEPDYALNVYTHGTVESACSEPTPIEAPGVVEGENQGPGIFAGSCGGANGSETVYRLQTAEDTPVCLVADGFILDPLLHVRTDCAEPGSEIACNDDGEGIGWASNIEFDATADTPYFVFVDGVDNAGAFELSVLFEACPEG